MRSDKLREEFLHFFEKKGHKVVPSSLLLPQDSSVLFTTAGMQQFVLYLAGDKDVLKYFGTRKLASCQKCFRTNDIDEVGDDTHHTFFEMLGNWSIGEEKEGYFKRGAISLALEFLIKTLGLSKENFYITIFKGNDEIKKDEESFAIWRENGIAEEKIFEFGMKDNFWGPVSEIGPCGPCSEIYYDRGEEYGCKEKCGPNCPNCQRFVEIWNLVFMEYNKKGDGSFEKLSQKNVDTGIGFERLIAVLNKKSSAYETDLFLPIIQEIKKQNKTSPENLKAEKIIADHVRGAVFLIAEGILPSNVERGYILRRILRRAIRYGKLINLPKGFLAHLAQKTIEIYQDVYFEIKSTEKDILIAIQDEEYKFEKTLQEGLKRFEKISLGGDISGIEAFHLYDTYGFPFELTTELAKEKKIKIDEKGFKEAFKKHQEISRFGAESKFGGLGEKADYEMIKFHTATHLLQSALREVLGDHVRQMGSDITSQRLRFDFSHPKKTTEEEIKKVENLVNQKIKEGLGVEKKEMSYQEAIKGGVLAFFKEKYPEKVSVYSVVDSSSKDLNGRAFSKEICAGPHVKKTSELGLFKIIKEESSGSGVRRIKAVLKKI